MNLEKEALTHRIEDDLLLRNRNWDALNTLLAGGEDKQVHSYGSDYIKFGNGWMICVGSISIGYGELVTNGSASFEKDFPQPFSSTPIVTHSSHVADVLRAREYTFVNKSYNSSITKFQITVSLGDTPRSSASVDYIAVGKWR